MGPVSSASEYVCVGMCTSLIATCSGRRLKYLRSWQEPRKDLHKMAEPRGIPASPHADRKTTSPHRHLQFSHHSIERPNLQVSKSYICVITSKSVPYRSLAQEEGKYVGVCGGGGLCGLAPRAPECPAQTRPDSSRRLR